MSPEDGFGYFVSLGMSLQDPESKHKIIHKLLELTNKRDHNKWKTVLQNDYLLSFFLPSKKFPVGEEHSDNSWTPRVCRLDGHCPCGNRHGSGDFIIGLRFFFAPFSRECWWIPCTPLIKHLWTNRQSLNIHYISYYLDNKGNFHFPLLSGCCC